MAKVAYRRVSTSDQSVDRQLPDEHFDKVFEDTASGNSVTRDGLARAMEYLRPGDVLVIHSIDRLARNLSDLERLVNYFVSVGVRIDFRSEKLSFKPDSNSDPVSKMMLQMIGAISEFERSILKERQKEGISAAIAAGKKFGRPKLLNDSQLRSLKAKRGSGATIRQLQDEFNLSRSTVYRLLLPKKLAA